ncbi:MAG: TerC family protein [Caldilineaceae bacterium]|jgi:tellurite resistance protein TerC|nr:TerC family protein [Caldilineaceae bacterium]
MATNPWFWILFNLFVIAMLALDLGVFNRKAHRIGVKEAAIWSVAWISLALIFNAGLYYFEGPEIAMQFLGGYLLEKSLSVDNIFVFVMIFTYFATPAEYQHRVLYWGILTALVLRGAMILTGAALISRFDFLIGIFGLLLIVTAVRMFRSGDEEGDLSKNVVVKMTQRFFRVTDNYRGQRFTIVEHGKRWITPLLVVLLVIETSDVVFAVDSIPAVFGITTDPFIVYTSNIFAILGLRSLYFLLAGVVDKFHYLKLGLSLVLGFVGAKMVVETVSDYAMAHPIHVPIQWSLLLIALVLGVSVAASLLFPRRELKPSLAEATEPMLEDRLQAQEELRRQQKELADVTGD